MKEYSVDCRHLKDRQPTQSGYEKIESITLQHAQRQVLGRPHRLPICFVGVVPSDSVYATPGKSNPNCVDSNYTNNLITIEIDGNRSIVWSVIEP